MHHVAQLHVEVIADDHTLQDQRNSDGITGGVGVDEAFVGRFDVVRTTSGKDTMDLDEPVGIIVVLLVLNELLDGHGDRTTLTVSHEVDIIVFGCPVSGFEPVTNG